jgi:hypothetical protein
MTPMFTEIRATNFKSWARLAPDAQADNDAQIDSLGLPLGRVTGLFGANSSGKTSILQIPLLLKQTAESADRRTPLDLGEVNSPIRLGAFADILRNHDSQLSLGGGPSWSDFSILTDDLDDPNGSLFSAYGLSFDAEIYEANDAMAVRSFQYYAERNRISYERVDGPEVAYRLTGRINEDSEYFTPQVMRRPHTLPAPVKCYGFPDQVNAYFKNVGFLGDLEFMFEEKLRRTYYLGPLREVPQPFYVWTGATPADVGYNGASAIPALLAAQKSGERENFRRIDRDLDPGPRITVEQHVAEWLQELGLVHSFRVAPVAQGADIYRAYVKRSEASPEVLLTDIGFGVSQVLPVLVLLAYVPPGSTVILEQPEIHLHPAVQSGLADVILEAALVRNVQVIVESHSEHLLTRIQLRVAEQQIANGTPVSADDIRLWFIDQAGPVSTANDLQLNEYGEIVNWPKDFFGDPFTETARIAKAGLRRRRNITQSLPTTQPRSRADAASSIGRD